MTRTRRAFTLIEIIVAVAIMAALATIMIPRFTSVTSRRFDHFTNQVGDFLMMFAQRDALGTAPIEIRMDQGPDGSPRLVMMTLDAGPDAADVSASGRDTATWRIDPFVSPIVLPRGVEPSTVTFIVNGETVDVSQWPLRHVPGEDRPNLEVLLQTTDAALMATVSLPRHAVAPRVERSRDRDAGRDVGVVRQSVDLDAEGRHRETW